MILCIQKSCQFSSFVIALLPLSVPPCMSVLPNLSALAGRPERASPSAGRPIPLPEADAQLVQSIPEGTPVLANPDLPFTKEVWLKMIRGAKRTIDTAQFYLTSESGESLGEVVDEIKKATARGVTVRLLVADTLLFDASNARTVEEIKKIPGVDLEIISFKELNGGGIQHSKYWIIDGAAIFVGSQNFDWRSLTQIEELGIFLKDPEETAKLQCIFNIDWKSAQTHKKPSPSDLVCDAKETDPTFELVADPPGWLPQHVRSEEAALLEVIAAAKKSLRIQVMDYDIKDEHAPDGGKKGWRVLEDALKAAAKRGVSVELLVSNWNVEKASSGAANPEKKFDAINRLKDLAQVPGIQVKVITIPKLPNRNIPYARVAHSKYMVVDSDVFWLGSSNWSESYFLTSRDVGMIIHRKTLIEEASKSFNNGWTSPFVTNIQTWPEN